MLLYLYWSRDDWPLLPVAQNDFMQPQNAYTYALTQTQTHKHTREGQPSTLRKEGLLGTVENLCNHKTMGDQMRILSPKSKELQEFERGAASVEKECAFKTHPLE